VSCVVGNRVHHGQLFGRLLCPPAGAPITRYQMYLPICPDTRPLLSLWESRTTQRSGNMPSGMQVKSFSVVAGTTRKSTCFTLFVVSTKSMRIVTHLHPNQPSAEHPRSVSSHALPGDAPAFLWGLRSQVAPYRLESSAFITVSIVSPPCMENLSWGRIASQPATTGCPRNRHDSAWALRGKAVLRRNRWESRFGREAVLSTANLALRGQN
jgi:hypothetical protein